MSLPTGVLTFCFTDIEGSTELWEQEPVAMAQALVWHDQLVARLVERHDGHLIQSMGLFGQCDRDRAADARGQDN